MKRKVNLGHAVYTFGKTWDEMSDQEKVDALTDPESGYVVWNDDEDDH